MTTITIGTLPKALAAFVKTSSAVATALSEAGTNPLHLLRPGLYNMTASELERTGVFLGKNGRGLSDLIYGNIERTYTRFAAEEYPSWEGVTHLAFVRSSDETHVEISDPLRVERIFNVDGVCIMACQEKADAQAWIGDPRAITYTTDFPADSRGIRSLYVNANPRLGVLLFCGKSDYRKFKKRLKSWNKMQDKHYEKLARKGQLTGGRFPAQPMPKSVLKAAKKAAKASGTLTHQG